MKLRKINFWIRYLFPVFLAIFLGTLIFMMAQFREPPGFAWHGVLWFVGSVFLIWESGWWIGKTLDRQIPWEKGTYKRLAAQLLATNLTGVLLFLGSFIILNWYETKIRGSNNALGLLHVMVVLAEAFIIVQIINSVQIGYQLLQNWQKVQLETEDLKKESVISRLEAMKQQLDPKNLNQSFDELELLIHEAPDQASIYLKELSEHYNNNQNHLSSSLINVQEELKVKKDESSNQKYKLTDRTTYRNRFLIRSGNRYLLIPIEKIVLLYKDDIVLLYTKEGKKISYRLYH